MKRALTYFTKRMLYVKFVGDYPNNFQREFVIDASLKSEAELRLKDFTDKDCSILFIDCIDDTSRYDTVITIGNYKYEAFTSWVPVL